MRLLIDRPAVARARRINSDRTADLRTYYILDGALIVCRNGLDLPGLAGQACDCAVGWDVAQPGFAPEGQIGKRRSKVTIYRILINRPVRTLTNQLRQTPP